MKLSRLFLTYMLIIYQAWSIHGQRPLAIENNGIFRRDSIEAILVELAFKNNPVKKVADYRAQAAEQAYKQEKRWPLEMVRLTGNLNEFTLNPDKYARSQFFPRYNFNLTLPLGDLFTRPGLVRTRRIESEISRLEAENEKKGLRTEVLRRYNRYVFARDRLLIEKKLESEIEINLELARSKFNKGSETYDTVSSLTERYYSTQIAVKEMEELLNEARIDLESIIGAPLETVIPE